MRTRRTAKERAEASVRSLVSKLARRRQQVAELEAELAEVQSILGAAAARPVSAPAVPREKLVLPAELAVQIEPQSQEPPVELAGSDNLGPGRWV